MTAHREVPVAIDSPSKFERMNCALSYPQTHCLTGSVTSQVATFDSEPGGEGGHLTA